MCGIVGFFTPGGFVADDAERTISRMATSIRHRGPDQEGLWKSGEQGIALGHVRLSVLDISSTGAQPMKSPNGRYIIVFNGEIYNHLELRNQLVQEDPSLVFRGHSDTESLLAGFDCWGLEKTLARCVGMFAFALWDKAERQLILARDRFGEKPLHYGWQSADKTPTLLFASELKAFHAHPAFEKCLNQSSVIQYFNRLCVPGEESIFEGVRKICPGTYLKFDAGAREGRLTRYWSLSGAIRAGVENRLPADEHAIVDATEEVLARAVKRQMISDVPLGAFLSGGVDSSTVVALMQRFSSGPVKTFNVGFIEKEFDESRNADDIASFLGTEHTKIVVTDKDAQDILPNISSIYDEPFADPSQIPTFIVSQLARQHVTVSLSGDAADELFAGYTRYGNAVRAWRIRRSLPAVAWSVISPPARALEKAMRQASSLSWATKAMRVAGMMDIANIVRYVENASDFSRLDKPARGASAIGITHPIAAQSDLERLCEYDIRGYLPDDILVKVDRAAMASSLETRAPFLDHEVAEFAFSIPPEINRPRERNGFSTKWPLRQVLYRHVPAELIERPKQGFGVPIAAWLRGGLRDWADSYLNFSALSSDELLDTRTILRLWSEHRSGAKDHSALLWAVLMYSVWKEKWL